ncbi:hypothetical protein ASH00_06735 [Arthrobacter sp. Soil782]|nr:hypothetical protein ASH00_06735 [Arthrobacter sp. Soil782]
MLLVVPDDVFLEDGDVTVGGLHVQVSEKGRSDVDGQAVVDEVGREESTEVVRCEPAMSQLWVLDSHLAAEFGEFSAQSFGTDHLGALPDPSANTLRF